MNLQLNESALNAYINEAIRQELNEALGKVGGKLAGKASQRTFGKMIRNGAKKFAGNLSGRRVKNAEALLDAAKKTADDATKAAQDAQKRVTTLTNNLGNKRVAQTATRWGTGAAAAGVGGYLLGRNKNGGNNPDAPWNDGVANPGMDDDAQDETGGNDGGFDGTFPWDNTEPQWTPRPTRKPAPTPAAGEAPAEPERPKAPEWAYQPISTVNGQTGVTGTDGTLKQHPESYVDSAKRVMLQTASAGLNGNTGNLDLITGNKQIEIPAEQQTTP